MAYIRIHRGRTVKNLVIFSFADDHKKNEFCEYSSISWSDEVISRRAIEQQCRFIDNEELRIKGGGSRLWKHKKWSKRGDTR